MRDDQKTKLYENIKQEIRSLLISSPKTKYGGLTGSLLYFDYKQLNCGKEIPYVELGFHSFLALLRSMPDVVRIDYKENSFSYRVHPVYDETTAHIQKMVFEQRDKYEYQNRLYNQNWYSNNNIQSNTIIPLNFYNDGQFPFLHNSFSCPQGAFNSVKTNFPISAYQTTNNFIHRSIPQNFLLSNDSRRGIAFQPYLLLPPQKQTHYHKHKEKINFQSIDLLSRVPSTSFDHHEISSTPNTFIETPTNFHFDDYRLNESINLNDKDIIQQHTNISSVDNQIAHHNSLSKTLINIIPDNLQTDQSFISPCISPVQNPCTNDKNVLPTIIDDISDHLSNNVECSLLTPASIVEEEESSLNNEIPSCNEQEESKIDENENLRKRLNGAIYECIHFRYIHRLCELKFEYRHYPLTNEILLKKSNLEKVAFDKYKNELEDFEKTFELNSSINEQKYEIMFDEYVYLQRNYYYMIKLMKKNKKIN